MPGIGDGGDHEGGGSRSTTLLVRATGDSFRLDGGPQDDAIDAASRTRVDGAGTGTHFALPRKLPEIPGVHVRRVVGTGSSGTVYLGRRQAAGSPLVAVKVLAPTLAGTVVEERFRREVTITTLIDSPYVIKTIASGAVDGLPYVVSVWAPGRSMTGLGPMSARFVVSVGRQMAAALAHLDRAGVVHRDVKPANIVVGRTGRRGLRSKLIDFGLARGPDDDETENGLLSPRQSLGSPNYMAPEQLEHPGLVDRRADIYSLGSTLYELLIGKPPFVGKPKTVLRAKLRGDAIGPVTGGPPPLGDLVMRMLSLDKDDRPDSAGEVSDVLDAIAADHFGSSANDPGTI